MGGTVNFIYNRNYELRDQFAPRVYEIPQKREKMRNSIQKSYKTPINGRKTRIPTIIS